MSAKETDATNDDKDALDLLEAESKEFDKVGHLSNYTVWCRATVGLT